MLPRSTILDITNGCLRNAILSCDINERLPSVKASPFDIYYVPIGEPSVPVINALRGDSLHCCVPIVVSASSLKKMARADTFSIVAVMQYVFSRIKLSIVNYPRYAIAKLGSVLFRYSKLTVARVQRGSPNPASTEVLHVTGNGAISGHVFPEPFSNYSTYFHKWKSCIIEP